MKTTLTVELDYDPAVTDPESLASAMDRLTETILSTPGIVEEYGNPTVGPFWVAQGGQAASQPVMVVEVSGGVVQAVYGSESGTRVILVDYDTEGCSLGEDGIVSIDDAGHERYVRVVDYPVTPCEDVADKATGSALAKAGISIPCTGDAGLEATRRWALYDFDADRLLTTQVFGSYEDAADMADRLNDVLVLPLVIHDSVP